MEGVNAVDAAPPSDTPTDQPPGGRLPDLTLVAALMNNTTIIFPETFTSSSCEVIEGCVVPGTRRLLRFDVSIGNFGAVDLVVGTPPPPGQTVPPFDWSPCHRHHHVGGFTTYELRGANGVVVTGRKQAFCLMDVNQVTSGAPSNGYTCAYQGLTVGWADTYSASLPCQWVDVTGLPSGTYTLRVEVNPEGAIEETDRSNNVWTQQVSI